MKKLILISAVCWLWTTPCVAGSYYGLIKPQMWGNGMYLYVVSGSSAGAPACATRSILRLQEFDMNDPAFKNKYAMILAAWYTQTPLSLLGTGQCTGEGDETIYVVNP